MTVFEMIINGDIPSTKIYEDDVCIAILDIAPRAKGHTLVISKQVYPTIADAPTETLAHMMDIVKKVDVKMREALSADGTNVIINNSPASGQEVPHLHIHVIPRKAGDGNLHHGGDKDPGGLCGAPECVQLHSGRPGSGKGRVCDYKQPDGGAYL